MEQKDKQVKNKGGRPKVAIKKDQMIPVKMQLDGKDYHQRKSQGDKANCFRISTSVGP